jgi:hypothetical protein
MKSFCISDNSYFPVESLQICHTAQQQNKIETMQFVINIKNSKTQSTMKNNKFFILRSLSEEGRSQKNELQSATMAKEVSVNHGHRQPLYYI